MSATQARSGTKVILVVDDDEDFVTTVRSVLEREGYTVVQADSGAEGLRQLRERRPDLVVLDIMMESTTEGYGVTEAIKYSEEYTAFQQTPIIMVSSIREAPDELFPRAPEVDMIRPDRYLTKPLDIPKFLEIVRKILRG
jgi:two-component system, OmpR family, phosphate regulon response regulator PhoB